MEILSFLLSGVGDPGCKSLIILFFYNRAERLPPRLKIEPSVLLVPERSEDGQHNKLAGAKYGETDRIGNSPVTGHETGAISGTVPERRTSKEREIDTNSTMKADINLKKDYKADTPNDITVEVTLGEGQHGRINLSMDGKLIDYDDDTLTHNFHAGSPLIGKTAVFDVTATQPDSTKAMTNVHYVFNGGEPDPALFDNSQNLTNGDVTTSYTDQFNFIK